MTSNCKYSGHLKSFLTQKGKFYEILQDSVGQDGKGSMRQEVDLEQVLKILQPIIMTRESQVRELLDQFGEVMGRIPEVEEGKDAEDHDIALEDIGVFGNFGELDEIDRQVEVIRYLKRRHRESRQNNKGQLKESRIFLRDVSLLQHTLLTQALPDSSHLPPPVLSLLTQKFDQLKK